MRRSVVTAMSGLSVAVVALGLHASDEPSLVARAVLPAGIVPASTPSRAPIGGPTRIASQRATTQAPVRTPSGPAASAARLPAGPAAAIAPSSETAPVRPPAAAAPSSAAAPAPRPSPSPSPSSVTINGTAVATKYGPVQVQITLTNGRIVRSDAIVYPQDTSRDKSINDNAVPDLDQETLQAQSSQIDTISGATYTSQGYRQSLQSALDAAHAG